MSFAQYPRHLETRINRFRTEHRLVILWPDYEIYDLLANGIPLEEICYYSSVAPLIVKIQSNRKDYDFPVNSKEYTHIAIFQRLEVDCELKRTDEVYLILTKRALAVNEVICRFINGRYIVTVQVMQLNQQLSFWGVQVLTDRVTILGPKYISKSKKTWHLDYQFDQPIKSLVFYSTRRDLAYGKNYFYGGELPKDANRQFCMKFRKFKNYIGREMNREEELLEEFQRQSLFKIGNANRLLDSEEREQEKAQESGSRRIKHKEETMEAGIGKQQQKQHHKSRKITIALLNQKSKFEIFNKKQSQSIQSLQEKINIISINASDLIIQTLVEGQHQKYAGIIQNEDDLEKIQSLEWSEQLLLLNKAAKLKLDSLFAFIYSSVLLKFGQIPKAREQWLTLFSLTSIIPQEQLKTASQQLLKIILIVHPGSLLKDSEEDIPNFNSFSNFSLRDCIVESLQVHNHECSILSDLLYQTMRLETKQNIFELYQSHQLIASQLIISESINNWIEKNGLFHILDADAVYTVQKSLENITYKPSEQNVSNACFKQNEDKGSAKISLSIQRCDNNSFICSKKYQYGQNLYQVFIFGEESSITCLVEQSYSLFNQNCIPAYHSFDITIDLIVDSQSFSNTFGWCFAHPSQSVGSRFQVKCGKSAIKCNVHLKQNIVHQSIMSYFGIRFAQLLALPKIQKQNQSSESNKKVIKRRSSFLLQQNLSEYNLYEHMEERCFFHNKCEKCEQFANKPSIYQLSFLDMYTLLKSIAFTNQFHAFLSLFKYFTLHASQKINSNILLQIIRWEHLSVKRMLARANLMPLQIQQKKLINFIIDKRMKIIGGVESQSKNNLISHWRKSGRTYQQIWLYYQEQYSEQYLTFLQNSPTHD